MLQNFLREGQTQISLLVLGIAGNTGFSVGDGQSVVFELDLCKGTIGIVDCQFALGNS